LTWSGDDCLSQCLSTVGSTGFDLVSFLTVEWHHCSYPLLHNVLSPFGFLVDFKAVLSQCTTADDNGVSEENRKNIVSMRRQSINAQISG